MEADTETDNSPTEKSSSATGGHTGTAALSVFMHIFSFYCVNIRTTRKHKCRISCSPSAIRDPFGSY